MVRAYSRPVAKSSQEYYENPASPLHCFYNITLTVYHQYLFIHVSGKKQRSTKILYSGNNTIR